MKSSHAKLHDTTALRQVLETHPDLPLLIIANADPVCGYCTDMSVEVCEILTDTAPVMDDTIAVSREAFESAVRHYLRMEMQGEKVSREEIEERVQVVKHDYAHKWREALVLWLDAFEEKTPFLEH
ncbi:MAG: hypothetical protein J6N77_05490 [Lachnospiraceae bacterium]|nr:hypothetical protein [Lachnospiraceae bacterium]